MNIRLLVLLFALSLPVRAAEITAISPDKKVAALNFDTGKIDAPQIWTLRPWRRKSTLVVAISDRGAVAFSRNGRLLAAGRPNGTIEIYATPNGLLWGRLGKPAPKGRDKEDLEENRFVAIAFSPDGTTLAATNHKGVFFWNYRSKKLLFSRPLWQQPEIDKRPSGPLRRADANLLCFSPDGKTLALGGRFTSAFLFDVVKKRLSHVLPLHAEDGGANALAFSPNGKRLLVVGFWNVSGGSFEQIHLFGTRSGRRVWKWNNKSSDPTNYDTAVHYNRAAFSCDGRRFAVANSTSLVIRDARTARFLSVCHQQEGNSASLETQKQLFPELALP